ncbi:MAG: hypothetical protein MUP18_02335 [Desulfobacterales bacterium]|nr:hypothetical protein [Desulfobacterales bacterium]
MDKEIERIKRESGPDDPRIRELENLKKQIEKEGLPSVTESIKELLKDKSTLPPKKDEPFPPEPNPCP